MAARTRVNAIVDTIKAAGSVSVAAYMADCIKTYYASEQPFGHAGDFITAPEASQLFGDMLGMWVLDVWQQLGRGAVHVIELGGGNGTLMADMMRIATKQDGFGANVTVHMVETSLRLRAIQARTVPVPVTFHDRVDSLPTDAPCIVIGNEFLDALPIEQEVLGPDGAWVPRRVVYDGRGLSFDPVGGTVREHNPAAQAVVRQLSLLVAKAGGALLLIDYGYEGAAHGDTVQAVQGHQSVDVFWQPGQADVTAHVDFAPLQTVARRAGLDVLPLCTQGAFLKHLGIETWAQKLGAVSLQAGLNRLIDDTQMGQLFKVFCAHHKTVRPAGF